eukprot:6197498-Pleurochrysis_carterae.AAC.2
MESSSRCSAGREASPDADTSALRSSWACTLHSSRISAVGKAARASFRRGSQWSWAGWAQSSGSDEVADGGGACNSFILLKRRGKELGWRQTARKDRHVNASLGRCKEPPDPTRKTQTRERIVRISSGGSDSSVSVVHELIGLLSERTARSEVGASWAQAL